MLIFQGFANSRIVREFPLFSFKVRIATLTRNQVVAQAARGFESHPVRQRKTGESNGFIGFYLFTDIHLYLIFSHDSKSISLIYYP